MKSNQLFSKNQFGFLEGRSTTLQLLTVLENWTKAIDQGHCIDTLYMDYQKAFDKVPHKRLISKLKSYNIIPQLVQWINSFLSKRSHQVCINDKASTMTEVVSGVPQGSVLGPVLFVIYINDLPNLVDSDVYLFADDTKIFKHIKDNQDEKNLQEDLDIVAKWCDTWLLKLHPDKCKHMRLGKQKNQGVYTILGNVLQTVNDEKDIGVITDDSLSFEKHICEKVKKSTQMFAMLRRSFQFLDANMFVPLYKTLVRTHLDYASPAWAPFKVKHTDMLESVQRRATKQIKGMKNLAYETERAQTAIFTLQTTQRRHDRGL